MNVVAFIPTQWQQLVGLRSAGCVQKSAAPPCRARAYYSAWELCFLRSWSTQIHLRSHFPELHLQGRGAQGVAIAFGANRSISAALRTIPPCPQGQRCTPSSTPSPQRCPLDRKHILCLAARSGHLLLGEQGLRSTGTATNKLQLQLGSAATDGKTTAGISMKKKKNTCIFLLRQAEMCRWGWRVIPQILLYAWHRADPLQTGTMETSVHYLVELILSPLPFQFLRVPVETTSS